MPLMSHVFLVEFLNYTSHITLGYRRKYYRSVRFPWRIWKCLNTFQNSDLQKDAGCRTSRNLPSTRNHPVFTPLFDVIQHVEVQRDWHNVTLHQQYQILHAKICWNVISDRWLNITSLFPDLEIFSYTRNKYRMF